MKNTLIVFLLMLAATASAQNYFSGQTHYCPMTDPEQKELWKTGFMALRYPEYWGPAAGIFSKIIEKDSTNCDAYFMTGYMLRITGKTKEALVYYYMADSLAQNRSLEFKQNLAAAALVYGNVKLARKKYEEMAKYFPSNPEGYYGVALTSTMIGDVDYGLKHMRSAFKIYEHNEAYPARDDAELLMGILLTQNELYEESLQYFSRVGSKLKKDDNFLVHYAYSLLKVSQAKSDEKMRQKALKYFDKVNDKKAIAPKILDEFKA